MYSFSQLICSWKEIKHKTIHLLTCAKIPGYLYLKMEGLTSRTFAGRHACSMLETIPDLPLLTPSFKKIIMESNTFFKIFQIAKAIFALSSACCGLILTQVLLNMFSSFCKTKKKKKRMSFPNKKGGGSFSKRHHQSRNSIRFLSLNARKEARFHLGRMYELPDWHNKQKYSMDL